MAQTLMNCECLNVEVDEGYQYLRHKMTIDYDMILSLCIGVNVVNMK